LEKYSDNNHSLTQGDIIKRLESDYNMPCERKAIKHHIDALIDLGYDIVTPDNGGYYLRQRTLEDCELRLLLDSVLANRQIPKTQAAELMGKLRGMGSIYFGKRIRHLHSINDWTGHDINTLFYNIEIIDEAIEAERKIAFNYYTYGIDKKRHKRREEKYIFNPYQMTFNSGRYYLVGNVDKHDNLSNFRIDLIGEIEVLESPRKPQREVLKKDNSLRLADYDKERVYPFAGEPEPIEIRIENLIISDIIDYFGKEFSIKAESDAQSIIRIKTVANAFFYWALQYGRFLEVLEPQDLRKRVMQAIKEMRDKYEDEQ
jgi:predicted DNA-binding transcriptional regulator YafY